MRSASNARGGRTCKPAHRRQGIHENTKLGLFFVERVGDDIPLRLSFDLGVLGEDRLKHRRDSHALLGRRMGEHVESTLESLLPADLTRRELCHDVLSFRIRIPA